MSRTWWIFLILTAMAMGACASRRSPDDPGEDEDGRPRRQSFDPAYFALWYPGKPGDSWTYEITSLNNTTQRKVSITGRDGAFILDDEGGRVAVDRYGVRDANRRYLLRGPVVKGTKWQAIQEDGGVEMSEIVSRDQEIPTPAGVFKETVCVRTTLPLRDEIERIQDMCFAKNTGIVYLDVRLKHPKKGVQPQMTMKLVSAQLKPGSE
ncbi:MAG: hypothetical protein GMKNLPBB_01396 [Myxococcota bacterium]|nr:hypothetical protein [Myxococcota bacterium]